MKGRSLLMLIVLFCVAAGAHAQKEVTLMNGLVYQYQEIKVDSNWVRFTYLKENKKLKTRILGYEDVFVVTDGKSQTIVYQMNRDTMEIPPYQDMKLFIAGIQSGRKTYNGTRHFIMGATVGLASGIALNSFLAGAPVPVVYTLVTTMFPVANYHFKNDSNTADPYRLGQKRQYKRMRTASALKSSLLGVAAGLVIGHYVAQ